MKLQILVFTVVFLGQTSFAQTKNINKFYGEKLAGKRRELSSKFQNFTVVKLESTAIANSLKGKMKTSFLLQLPGFPPWEIELQPSGITSEDYKLKVQTQSGIQPVSSNPNFLYKGRVKESNKNEEVRLAIKEGFVYGSVQTLGKEYFIEPLNWVTTANKDEFIIYEAKDLLINDNFSCGVNDKEFREKIEKQNSAREQSPLGNTCKKVKFIAVADYSIFQKFGEDVYTVETALLSNLNLVEGAFGTLNLGADGTTDVGTDKLQFEMEEIVVSTCRECGIGGIAPGEEGAANIGTKLLQWAAKNIVQKDGKIIQHWTAGSLFDIAGRGLSGTIASQLNCYGIGGQILRYGTDDPAFLRALVAHETGHLFGCPHDDDRKADVTSFIMYSAANASCKRFSTLADFGGLNYSSQQTIRTSVLINSACLPDCGINSCEEVKDLKISNGSVDNGIQFTWTGSGSYLIKYKLNDSVNYDPSNIKETNLNNIYLKELNSCALYKLEILKNCGGEYSRATTVLFKTSSLSFYPKPINLHGDKYDLELDMDCKGCSDKEYFIKIDGVPYNLTNSASQKKIIFKDLFADGARHRVDISKDSGNVVCMATTFYKAPYYRASSIRILNADFNDCVMPSGWKDSLLAKNNVSAPDAHWFLSQENYYTSGTVRGSIDSSCMIYYNSFGSSNNPYSGAISLTSPKIDLTKYKDVQLHYDYNFLAYKFSTNPPVGSITVEVFNGINWEKIGERQADLPNKLRNIWDSIPQRVFVALAKYNNKDFQVRFIVDDGSLIQKATLGVLAAFDNIVVDGYLKDASFGNDIIVYPNPAKNEMLVRFIQQPVSDIKYRLIDVSGAVIRNSVLKNYRIDMMQLSSGMYLLELYHDNDIIATKKVMKY